MKLRLFLLGMLLVSLSMTARDGEAKKEFKIPYEQYRLANGLDVILHVDKSDPIATVYVCYHVGSNREKKGKTGFAHLFEHIMFQESQHIPQDQFFKKIQGAGGVLNGSTSNDRTNYFETVPRNALEMALWMEADRMGFLLSKLTQAAFENQQNVVQNEKRQGDNQPYSQDEYVLGKLMYPENHPYNWDVIGEMDDLANAALQDVIDFYKEFYGPKNATLVVAGDIDVKQTKAWIEKYYGEIAAYNQAQPLPKMRVSLNASKRAYIEDKLANAPDLTLSFPTVERYDRDAYALRYLAQLLAEGKKSPLYKVIVEEKKLAPAVSASSANIELAGTLDIHVRAFPGRNLGEVEMAIREGLSRFEKEGFVDKDLQRLKKSVEVGFYNSIASVMGKAMRLAEYNEYAGAAGFMNADLNNSLHVSKEDIWRVYDRYVKGRNSVLLSIVPRGKADLAAPDSSLYPLPEEALEHQGVKKAAASQAKGEWIPTRFDRTLEPAKGPDPLVNPPAIWSVQTANGIRVYGIKHGELPLVQFAVILKGGMLLDPRDKIGTAFLAAKMLNEGTKTKTAIELREAAQDLGATISVTAGPEAITLTGTCLAGKFEEAIALAREMLLEPRWDEKEFPLVKSQTSENLKRMEAMPATIASTVFSRLLYGKDCVLASMPMGSLKSIESITMADLKNYYENNFSPSVAKITVVGDVSRGKALAVLGVFKEWPARDVAMPEVKISAAAKPGVYFVDIPGAQQSQFRVGHLSLPYSDPEYYKTVVMNYKLGGDFNGILNMILREEKGFTYGARSGFTAFSYPGFFTAATSVQTNATLETARIIHDELAKYRESIAAADLAMVQSTLLKGNALKFETLNALSQMLTPIVMYDLPFTFIKDNEAIVHEMTPAEHARLAQKYLQPEKMIYLIVGDKATQFDMLQELGLGAPVLLDRDANPVGKGKGL